MHELAICQALIDQVDRVSRENGGRRVLTVTVAVGALSGVEGQLLEHAFPLAAAGTVAQGASLVVESIPVTVRCRTCRAESEAAPNRLVCGACRDWQVEIISGEELLLQRVEIETVAKAG